MVLQALPRDDQGLARSLGEAAGKVAALLREFRHPALARPFRWDVAQALDVTGGYLPEIATPSRRALR